MTSSWSRAPMGLPKWKHIKAILGEPTVAARWQWRHGKVPNDDDVDALYERFLPLQVAVVGEHAGVIAGVVETVAALREWNRSLEGGARPDFTATFGSDVIEQQK